MYRIRFTTQFKKDTKKLKSKGHKKGDLDLVLSLLTQGKELPDRYRDHALIGNWKGHRECHIKPDWLLIYCIDEDENVIICVRTGSHSDLFS